MVTAFFFYLFSTLAIASGACVVLAKNPVHAVLYLILTFFNAAGLFVLLNAEFLAMLLIVVYVGAVAVLFLFVVMMLDVDFDELKAGFIKNAPIGALVGGIVLAELVALFAFQGLTFAPGKIAAAAMPSGLSNTEALGHIIYTKYVFFFQTSGMILLVAMIGAIVLTLRHRQNVKRQSISEQNARSPATAMEVIKLPSGGYNVPAAVKPKTEAAE
ncbi:MAG: NADH-quinone oxidoreductase subunit J [Hyphomicrobium sp.]|nr:NADH-quinone oxidoreductase subunit J [Hyphomicrobium sp.]